MAELTKDARGIAEKGIEQWAHWSGKQILIKRYFRTYT